MSDTIAVRDGEQVDTVALRRWLALVRPELVPAGGAVTVTQFPNGFSNLTYLVRVEHEDGVRSYVLRRPPRGVKPGSAHDVGREHDILAALFPLGVPVPRPIARCDDVTVIGAPFYLMEHVDGLILRGKPPVELAANVEEVPAILAALSKTFVATLVQLHAVDISQPPLSSFGKPDGYARRQVQGWTRRWHAARTQDVPDIELVARWLEAHAPRERPACLVHNDFKFDNLVLGRNDFTRVLAILDWEMATIGDPMMDLGTTLAYWVEAGDDPIFRSLGLGVTAQPGMSTRADLVQAYGVASGRDVSEAPYHYAFGLFKVAVIAQQIFARYEQGLTRDPRFAALGNVVQALGGAAAAVIGSGAI